MPVQTYECPKGHLTERSIPMEEHVTYYTPCDACYHRLGADSELIAAEWRPPTGINFIIKDGGTGAQKGSR